MSTYQKPELLAPAGNFKKLKYAFRYGADACYGSGPSFSMRVNEIKFSYSDLKEAIRYTRKLSKKFYLTLNIYATEKQLKLLPNYIKKMAKLRPDAFIIADPAVIRIAKKVAPNIEIHLSTQANALSSQAIKFWQDQGISRVILARETTYEDLRMITKNISDNIGLEYFIHGSMCISYSGRCLLSSYFTGRSANQGQCSQPCRWQYILNEIKDPKKELILEEDKYGSYLLNSKTLCLIDQINRLKKLNLTSYKIEGRNKSIYYLATVTRAYRQVIDAIYSEKSESEISSIVRKAKSNLNKTANRGFITGFLFNKNQASQEYLTSRPQSSWQYSATTIGNKGDLIKLRANNQIFAGKTLEFVLPDKDIVLKPKHFLIKNKNSYMSKIIINTNDIFYIKSNQKKPIEKGVLVRSKKLSHKKKEGKYGGNHQ